MSAFEHPSNHHDNARPQVYRACWCNTSKSRWGCYVCDDKPTPVDKPIGCATCTCVTFNIVTGTCDPCQTLFERCEAQLADVDQYTQSTPVLCNYCHARATKHWSAICDVCSEAGR